MTIEEFMCEIFGFNKKQAAETNYKNFEWALDFYRDQVFWLCKIGPRSRDARSPVPVRFYFFYGERDSKNIIFENIVTRNEDKHCIWSYIKFQEAEKNYLFHIPSNMWSIDYRVSLSYEEAVRDYRALLRHRIKELENNISSGWTVGASKNNTEKYLSVLNQLLKDSRRKKK